MLRPAKRGTRICTYFTGGRKKIVINSFLLLVLSLLVTIFLETGNYDILDLDRFYKGIPLKSEVWVTKVIDGDTIVIDGGDRVRYVGIDTPEKGSYFYLQATSRNRELVEGKRVKLSLCKERRRDKYGRLLAYVDVDGTDVATTLLKEGLANSLYIPPCGKDREEEFYGYLLEAKKKGSGMWAMAKR